MDDINTIDAKVNEFGDVTLVMNTGQARDLLALLRNSGILEAVGDAPAPGAETAAELVAAVRSLSF